MMETTLDVVLVVVWDIGGPFIRRAALGGILIFDPNLNLVFTGAS